MLTERERESEGKPYDDIAKNSFGQSGRVYLELSLIRQSPVELSWVISFSDKISTSL